MINDKIFFSGSNFHNVNLRQTKKFQHFIFKTTLNNILSHWKGIYTGMNADLTVPTNLNSIPFDLYVESFEKDIFYRFIEDHIMRRTTAKSIIM